MPVGAFGAGAGSLIAIGNGAATAEALVTDFLICDGAGGGKGGLILVAGGSIN